MVQGLAQLHARFAAVPDRVKVALAETLEAQADKIVADMRRLVPTRTGALRNSIGWTWGAAPRGSVTIGQVRSGARKGQDYEQMAITIYAGTRNKSLGAADAFYARFQEFGTRKMAANPFFYPAWRANKTATKSAITRAIRRAVRAG